MVYHNEFAVFIMKIGSTFVFVVVFFSVRPNLSIRLFILSYRIFSSLFTCFPPSLRAVSILFLLFFLFFFVLLVVLLPGTVTPYFDPSLRLRLRLLPVPPSPTGANRIFLLLLVYEYCYYSYFGS